MIPHPPPTSSTALPGLSKCAEGYGDTKQTNDQQKREIVVTVFKIFKYYISPSIGGIMTATLKDTRRELWVSHRGWTNSIM